MRLALIDTEDVDLLAYILVRIRRQEEMCGVCICGVCVGVCTVQCLCVQECGK